MLAAFATKRPTYRLVGAPLYVYAGAIELADNELPYVVHHHVQRCPTPEPIEVAQVDTCRLGHASKLPKTPPLAYETATLGGYETRTA